MNRQYDSTALTFLAQHELFRGLPIVDLQRLAAGCTFRTYPKRAYLFLEGQEGHSAFLLIRGRVTLIRNSPDGREVVIKTAKAGDLFAEVVLFESPVYPVSAEAIAESRCVEIRRSMFRSLCDEPAFRDRFIALLMERQRYLTGRVRYLMLYDLEERFFMYLREQFGNKSLIEPGISRKDIAAAIGATPESLSRLIRRLTDEGRLVWKGKTIRIKGIGQTDFR